MTAGALPPNLSLSPGGVISGTPVSSGSYTFTVTATDSTPGGGCSQTAVFTISIGCAGVTINPPNLPSGTDGVLYNQVITATGGSGAFTFHSGVLPPGLSLTDGGLLWGFISGRGTYTISITATDVVTGCTTTKSYTLVVSCPSSITITPTNLPGGTTNATYPTTRLTAQGGSPPDSFRVTNGALPAGLRLESLVVTPPASASAQIIGTPTAAGTFNFDVAVTDHAGCTGLGHYSITVGQACAPGEPTHLTLASDSAARDPEPTYVDNLIASWMAPTDGPTPTKYVYRVNGQQDQETTDTTGTAPPQATAVANYLQLPFELFVTAYACDPLVPGTQAVSQPPYSPTPPASSFNAVVVAPGSVQVTDSSGPQATSWLWLWGDGLYDQVQAPPPHTYPNYSHDYTSANQYTIVLIATNGAGSHQFQCTLDVSVANQNPCQAAGGSAGTAPGIKRDLVVRVFDVTQPARQKLEEVSLLGGGEKWLQLSTSQGSRDKIIYLRFLDAEGKAIVERRLVLSAEQTDAVYNIEAFGVVGEYTLELVTDDAMAATLIDTAPINRVNPPKGTREVGR